LGGDIVYGIGEGCRSVGIRHPRGAGFEGGDNTGGVGKNEREVGGNAVRQWHSQEGGLYTYTDMSHIFICEHMYIFSNISKNM